jgi:hypothetical protein
VLSRQERPTPIHSGAGTPHGADGVRQLGHREYVGGKWDEIGRLQFDYLVSRGLEPHHVLLDIACGSLRGGVHFIRYLDPGNYLGVDKEHELVARGLEHELPPDIREAKRPELLVNDRFEFERLSKRPDMALAQSLFTHLPASHIERCLAKLRAVAPAHHCFYATFLEVRRPVENPERPHDAMSWFYTRRQMLKFGNRTGWRGTYIGDWDHPRDLKMVLYRPRRSVRRTSVR